MKNKFSFIILVFVLIFVFTEFSIRLITHLNKKTFFPNLTIDDPVLDWRLMPNYKDEKAGIYINSLGFRGKEFKKEKEGGIFRIIALGDSCTFGVGSQNSTYPQLLETKLNTRNIKYQVINAGVPAYTSSQLYLYLQHDLINYKPDLILIYIGWNNIWTYKNPAANTAYSPQARKLSRILSKSFTFALLRDYIVNPLRVKLAATCKNSKQRPVSLNKINEKLANFKKDLAKIIDLTKENNCRLILFTLPTPIRTGMPAGKAEKFKLVSTWTDGNEVFLKILEQLNQKINDLASAQKTEVIDFNSIFNKLSGNQVGGFFADAVHLNDSGTEFIVPFIAEKINQESKQILSGHKND